MFSAFNPSKCTHLEQWAADCAAPGEQSWTSCQSRDSNPQPWVTSGRISSPTLYPLGQRLPYMVRVHLLQFETRWVISLLCQTTKVHAGLLGQVCDKNTKANKLSPCKAAYNPEMRNSLGHNRINHPQ